MNNYNLTNDLNNVICEAVDCTKHATQNIVLQLTNQNQIVVHVCKNCVNKFIEVHRK